MSNTTTPAGWYPDPSNPSQQRYWDGVAWTDATAPAMPGYGAPGFGAYPTYGAYPAYGTTAVGYGYTQSVGAPLAGFWTRFAANLIDGLLLGIPALVISLVLFDPFQETSRFGSTTSFTWSVGGAPGWFQLVSFAVQVSYFAYFLGTSGQTLGAKVVGVRVVDARSLQPGVGIGRGVGRYFGSLVSGAVCYLGYLWMLWDDQNETWHDKMAGTKVVKVLR